MDASGDQVGKVKDVVVQMRTPGRAPLVRGLVVERARPGVRIWTTTSLTLPTWSPLASLSLIHI